MRLTGSLIISPPVVPAPLGKAGIFRLNRFWIV
jgi:hypothetical protein